jgi:AraC-like DNA-binding protein/ligand-binding sensor protein
MNSDKELIQTLTTSRLYQEYERAFSDATGLPLSLRPVESWQLPHHGKRAENLFCSLLAQKSKACGACLQVQQELSEGLNGEPKVVTCPAGLCDMAIPVRLGERLIGLLVTGQVLRKRPTEAQYDKVAKLLGQWGFEPEAADLRAAYFGTRVLNVKEQEAVLKLLGIFAQHLSILCNQLVVQQENAEPPMIRRAKEFIAAHHGEELSLGLVAKAVNSSAYYFCKMFKRYTGLNFTDYLCRVRIEKARNLLLNPNLRISEIAFESGFQSLTHFNRVFKRINGQSPTEYRSQLDRAA